MSREIRTFIVDSFTKQPFQGNPAGVCLSDVSPGPEQMQLIAQELNLSETAFLTGTGGNQFSIRYFWPWSGGMEDPVTGGTHTFLAKYWSDKMGKTIMRWFQSSARTGQMEVELTASNKLLIRGQAVMVLAGVLTI